MNRGRFLGRGLSPRGRGKPRALERIDSLRRSIPAWAGETRLVMANRNPNGVYPRVGGGNFTSPHAEQDQRGLSPRGRGKPAIGMLAAADMRSIPAWAGETRQRYLARVGRRVYPRVGGGNTQSGARNPVYGGLSPRGRGKLAISCLVLFYQRSIPAWAGETQGLATFAPGVRVYPRVGGGNPAAPLGTVKSRGLSPRGRGKLTFALGMPTTGRSIPAWAGETIAPQSSFRLLRVYPRVGGGNC